VVGAESMKVNLATDCHAGSNGHGLQCWEQCRRMKDMCLELNLLLLSTKLLGLTAQSLMGSPGTLDEGEGGGGLSGRFKQGSLHFIKRAMPGECKHVKIGLV